MKKPQNLTMREEKQDSISPLKEMSKQNCKSLDGEAKKKIIVGGKEGNEKDSQLKNLSELQDTGLPQLVSQRHSTPESNKTTSKSSTLHCEAVMKSLAQTCAVVEMDTRTEEGKGATKTGDCSEPGDGSDGEECTVIGVSEDMSEEKEVDSESDTKPSEVVFSTTQDRDDCFVSSQQ